MRSILLIALSTAIACETTDEDATQNEEEAASSETARQASDNITDLSIPEGIAGGMVKNPNELVYFEGFDNTHDDAGNGWGPVPLEVGVYHGLIEMVDENDSDTLVVGDEFGAKITIDKDGNTLLDGGLFEHAPEDDRLRFTRTKEAPFKDSQDCFVVEIIKGTGLMDSDMSMEMDFVVTTDLDGASCPVVDASYDSFSVYFEHHMIELDQPLELDFTPQF